MARNEKPGKPKRVKPGRIIRQKRGRVVTLSDGTTTITLTGERRGNLRIDAPQSVRIEVAEGDSGK